MFLAGRRVIEVSDGKPLSEMTMITHRVEVAEIQDGIRYETTLEEGNKQSESQEGSLIVHPELRSCHCKQTPCKFRSVCASQ